MGKVLTLEDAMEFKKEKFKLRVYFSSQKHRFDFHISLFSFDALERIASLLYISSRVRFKSFITNLKIQKRGFNKIYLFLKKN